MGGPRAPFVIPMPPPNVTAVLHVGHALNDTAPDVLARWRRMVGDETLWLPGTDHAGIATQNVVERLLVREGTSRTEVGREAFIARTIAFVTETGGTILEQLKALGASADWTRTAYTFSPQLSRVVREVFVRLHEEGLIYRGHRVIHWCPRCLTALSDEEAEHEEEDGELWYIRYPVVDDPSRALVVATTRPETMLGDVAVAVNPDDDRYRDLVGRRVTLPVVEIEIPVIADAAVDAAFGTGAVKVTPAHDPNDFEIGTRHGLAAPIVMSPAATMEEGAGAERRVPPTLRGLDRFVARQHIVTMLQNAGLIEKIERHRHAVRHCYRCDTVVEPRLSDQWFVRMAPLARPALEAVRSGAIRIVPDRWIATYERWLEGIRDWNISRQLWWGHRIPVWYCDACGWTGALREDPTACPQCGSTLRQDEDVLDTWFSSWLWPFSTLGWPDDTADFRAFYPTDVLISAPDILFFWVARMIMAGLHFTGHVPFHTVYLHGVVRDTEHRKMSKSLGNGIDPLDVIALYGADALRYTLISRMGLGADVILDPASLEKSFAPGRNFVTKLWNIGRFLLTNVGDDPVESLADIDAGRLTRADHWILARLDAAIAASDAALGPARPPDAVWPPAARGAGLRLNEYAEAARAFVWNDLADWYVEHSKRRLTSDWDAADQAVARAVLVHTFDSALRLLHPIVPFITEALWQRLPSTRGFSTTPPPNPVPASGEGEKGFSQRTSPPTPDGQDASCPAIAATSGPEGTKKTFPPDLPEGGEGGQGGEEGQFLTRVAWPRVRKGAGGARQAADYELVRAAVSAIRQIRADYHVPPDRPVEALIIAAARRRKLFTEEADAIGRLGKAVVQAVSTTPGAAAATALLPDGSSVLVPLAGVVDVDKERARLRGELTQTEKLLAGVRARLGNPAFTERAKAEVVDGARQQERELATRSDQLRSKIASLCGA